MRSRGCCARPPASRVLTGKPPAIVCATGFPTQTRRICCSSMTCWASPIPMLLYRIDPDARRRRLTALVNAASLARETPAVYVIEDAHWIDEVSESMLAEFLTVIPQTPSLVLVTYRPEYRGCVGAGARCSNHRPCAAERSGDRSTGHRAARAGPLGWWTGQMIAERAAGNPFFAEEIVRELAERGVLRGEPQRIRFDGRGCRDQRACHRCKRPSPPASIGLTRQAKRTLERSGGHRLTVQPGPARNAGH